MDIRDIVVWLGIGAIALIIWDGMRRMKAAKPKKPVVQDDWVDPEEEARKAELARELPNGGARIRTMTRDEQVELKSKLNLRERVPMLMERVEVETSPSDQADETTAKDLQSELDFSAAMADFEDEVDTGADVEPDDQIAANSQQSEGDGERLEQENDEIEAEIDHSYDDEADAEVGSPVSMPEPADAKTEVQVDYPDKAVDEIESAASVADPGPVEDLVIVHVMAPNEGELSGSLLLDLLITAGLRHGPMNIFHYRNPQGITEFSLANCIQPGTFDPDAMNQVNTPGVTLFMQLPTAADALESFDHMIEMAKFLAKHLEAEILDEDHSSVTGQRIEYYREKIRAFVRSKLIPS